MAAGRNGISLYSKHSHYTHALIVKFSISSETRRFCRQINEKETEGWQMEYPLGFYFC